MHVQKCYYSSYSSCSSYNNYICGALPSNYYEDYNDHYSPCDTSCKKCENNPYNCLECHPGFYHRQGDDVHCYSHSESPGYYLYENHFLLCNGNCATCFSSTNKDCITCSIDHYFTEDTRSCLYKDSENYYLDNDILRKCHQNCKKCSSSPINDTFMNCLVCQDDYFITKDTNSCYTGEIDNYYLDKTESPPIYKRCHPNCLRCNTSHINETHLNV